MFIKKLSGLKCLAGCRVGRKGMASGITKENTYNFSQWADGWFGLVIYSIIMKSYLFCFQQDWTLYNTSSSLRSPIQWLFYHQHCKFLMFIIFFEENQDQVTVYVWQTITVHLNTSKSTVLRHQKFTLSAVEKNMKWHQFFTFSSSLPQWLPLTFFGVVT